MVEFEEESIARIHEIPNSKNLGAVSPKILGSVDIKGKKVMLMGKEYTETSGHPNTGKKRYLEIILLLMKYVL